MPNECFRFVPGDSYRVELGFRRIPEDAMQAFWWRLTGVSSETERTLPLIDTLTVQTTADFISPYGQRESIGWDFYSLLPGSRSEQDATPQRGDPEDRYSERPPCV